MNSLKDMQKELCAKKLVPAPKFVESSVKVLKADLKVYFDGSVDCKDSILDPFLVALKAAVNWSALKGKKLLPACGQGWLDLIPDIETISCDIPDSSDNMSAISVDSFAAASDFQTGFAMVTLEK